MRQYLAVLNSRVEREPRYCFYNLFFWLIDFDNPLEIEGFVIFSQPFSFHLIKRKQVQTIPTYFSINES